MASLAVGMK